MNLTYEKCGDYLIPNLISDPEPEGEVRKLGLMRKSYLKNYRRGIYSGLLLSGELKKLFIVYKNVGQRNLLLFHVLMKFIAFSIKKMHNKMRILNEKYRKIILHV
jgi:hypothetical protein